MDIEFQIFVEPKELLQFTYHEWIELAGKWDPLISWSDFKEEHEYLQGKPQIENKYELVERRNNVLHQKCGEVSRFYVGNLAAPVTDELIPHGFGYALIEGAVRPCMMRGYWWLGHFRYGDRMELADFPRPLVLRANQKFIKLRSGFFHDSISISYFQASYLFAQLQYYYVSTSTFAVVHPVRKDV